MCGAKHLHIMLPHVHAVEGLNREAMIYSESARSVLVMHSSAWNSHASRAFVLPWSLAQ